MACNRQLVRSAPAWLMLLPSTIRSRSAKTASSSGGNLDAKRAPATCPSQSAAPLSRRRSATSESRATPLASAHVAADRRLRPPGPWASAKRSNVAPSPTFRLRTSAPLARAEASRSRTPESRFSNTDQCRSKRDTECGAAGIRSQNHTRPRRVHPKVRAYGALPQTPHQEALPPGPPPRAVPLEPFTLVRWIAKAPPLLGFQGAKPLGVSRRTTAPAGGT
jgi:hypothetical protein